MRIRSFIFFFLLSLAGMAQKKLNGHVFIVGSKNPVVSANVYLSTTSVGTTTNEKGEFTLQNFPGGRFDLVVSCIGYETYHVAVQSNQLPPDLEIFLQPKVQELQEVIVESYDKDGWEKWGTIFLNNFIGTSPFADDCKLLNSDVIKLRLIKKRNTVRATATDQLVIENKALGYILKYDLTQFEYNLDTREFLYQGYPFFEEMQATRKGLEKRWNDNRQTAYYGSLMHFMRSLHGNKLKEEQFEVREWVNISAAERKRVKEMYPAQSKKLIYKITTVVKPNGSSFQLDEIDTAIIIHPDSLAYFQSIMKQPDQENILINMLLSTNDLAYEADSGRVGLNYKKRLQVVYRPKRNPLEYQKYVSLFARFSSVSSDLYRITEQPVFVLPNGAYYEGLNIITGGYWSWWEKMCNKLPYDYWPPPKK